MTLTTLMLVGTLAILPLAGCETTPSTSMATSAPGDPPPEGFATWEDYHRAQDRLTQDFRTDTDRLRSRLPEGPGRPW